MKVRLLRRTLKESRNTFTLYRERNSFIETWKYSILKHGRYFNPFGCIHSIHVKFTSGVSCTEQEAIEALKQTIKGYAYDLLHDKYTRRKELREEEAFNKRWRNSI